MRYIEVKSRVNDFVLSLLPELGTMGSNEGEVWVTGLSTLLRQISNYLQFMVCAELQIIP